jgi:hypothetical protein
MYYLKFDNFNPELHNKHNRNSFSSFGDEICRRTDRNDLTIMRSFYACALCEERVRIYKMRQFIVHILHLTLLTCAYCTYGGKRKQKFKSPSSAEVKKAWSYTYTPLIRLHGVVLS